MATHQLDQPRQRGIFQLGVLYETGRGGAAAAPLGNQTVWRHGDCHDHGAADNVGAW